MLIDYTNKGAKGLHKKTLWLIQQANTIIEKFDAKGYKLTLRQLYYQMVAADLIPNKDREYKNLGNAISEARQRGLISWEAIVDRLRNLKRGAFWDNPHNIVESCAYSFRRNVWGPQPVRVEVWVEKDALSDVVSQACSKWRVPYMVCRGYASQTALWESGRRMQDYIKAGKRVEIFHLGDHDPSGMHMTEDNSGRLSLFSSAVLEGDIRRAFKDVTFTRLALNMDQVEQYEPPPNPAKESDSRWAKYVEQTGTESSWELDALDPSVITGLIHKAVGPLVDKKKWEQEIALERENRQTLQACADNWFEVTEFLKGLNTNEEE